MATRLSVVVIVTLNILSPVLITSFGIWTSTSSLPVMLTTKSSMAGPLSVRLKLMIAFRDGDPLAVVRTGKVNVTEASDVLNSWTPNSTV